MTTSAVTPRVSYNGSGSTGPFSIPFSWAASTELVVTKTSTTGVESTLAVTTHFTLTGAGTNTGTLTLVTPLATGETLVIERATTQTQSVDFTRSYLDFNVLEGALDKLTRHAQDLWFQIGRTLKLAKDDAAGSGSYDAGGQKISNLAPGVNSTDAATVGQIQPIQGSIQDAVDAADAAAVSAAEAEASAIQAGIYADLAEGAAAASVLPNTFSLSGDISPAQITATQNNYNPTDLSTSTVLRLTTDAERSITGLAGGTAGRILLVHNVGSFNLILEDEHSGSTEANRFALDADVTLKPDQSALLQYDDVSTRWRMLGGIGGNVVSGSGATIAASAPVSPVDGDLWYDTSVDILYVYVDGTGWVTSYSPTLAQIDGLSKADGNIIVGNGSGWVVESGATARTSLGLAIGVDVQAYDTFLQDIADLSDPNADRILFWDDSAGDLTWLTIGSGLSVSGTTLSASSSSDFAPGTFMLFQQTAAPTGWTKQTTHNNKALRVVSGTASSGGTVEFTTAFSSKSVTGSVSGTVGSTTLTTSQMPAHTHSYTGTDLTGNQSGSTLYVRNQVATNTGSQGGGESHTHSWSGTFTGDAINMAVQYVDLIIASKD